MGLVQLVPPAIEPLTVAEVITHLRLSAQNLEPAPSAPGVALVTAAGNVTNGAHRYRSTFVTPDGETQGGDISDIATTDNTHGQVDVTLPLGGSAVTARRLFRTLAGGSDFFLVATINDNSTETYRDNLADGALGVGCPSTNTTADSQLLSLIGSARRIAETHLSRAIIAQQWRYTFDCFPDNACQWINLPLPSLISVDAFEYRDYSGAWLPVDPTLYEVDTAQLPGRIIKKFTRVWPITLPQPGVVRVDFTCGYGTLLSTVPESIRAGMKLLIGDLYANREATIDVRYINEQPVLKRLFATERYVEAH